MKVISELKREEFEEKFGSHRDFKYFGRPRKHCYLAALTKGEFENLGMNSSPENPFPEKGRFPVLKDSIWQFSKNPEYLKSSHPERGISGTTVAKYLKQFQDGMRLESCFITDDIIPNSYYICEGMHRLTAYGLYKKMEIQDHEVTVYYLTDKEVL
ncbi:MAG: hypothetical protein HY545_02250 [Candidatus Doudnabacteria bacterium]|nr:hypothetical protein [Candidatus Doudnabacteria bacterium]